MKTTTTARFKELMRLKNEFNEKLKDSFEKYESRIREYNEKNHKISKSPSSIELTKNNLPLINKPKARKLFPLTKTNYIEQLQETIRKKPKHSHSQIKIESKIWSPPYMIGNYFDKFKRLQDKHEIDNWEKVIYIKLIFINT